MFEKVLPTIVYEKLYLSNLRGLLGGIDAKGNDTTHQTLSAVLDRM